MNKLWKPALLLAAIAVMVIGTLGSGAWFKDHATTDPSKIHTGTLSIDEDQLTQLTFDVPNLVPGGETGPMEFYVVNNGNTDLAWFGNMILGGYDDSLLKNAIYIKTAKTEFLGGSAGTWQEEDDWYTGNGVPKYADFTNTQLDTNHDGFTSLAEWDDNAGMGAAPYEFTGVLKPGYAYKFTMNFGMLESADDSYQNKGPMTITIKVDATQVNLTAIHQFDSGYANLVWFNTQLDMQH